MYENVQVYRFDEYEYVERELLCDYCRRLDRSFFFNSCARAAFCALERLESPVAPSSARDDRTVSSLNAEALETVRTDLKLLGEHETRLEQHMRTPRES